MSENQEIPNGWVIADLQDAVDVFDNLRKPINFDEREKRIAGKKENELYPYYGATGQVGWIDDFITDGEYVLVGEDGAPFLDFYKPKAYIIKGKTWVNNHAHILRFKEGLTTNAFILHFLNHFNYNGYVNGTTRLKLTKSRLAEIPFPIPPHPDQTRIVAKIEELFSSLDKGIESLKTAQQQLKVYRQAVLKWAFEGKLTNKNVIEGELPAEWKWSKLKEITSVLGDGLHGTPKYSGSGEYYFINGNNLSDGKIEIKENTKRVSINEYEKYKKPLNESTIFVSINGTLGNTAFYNAERVILGKSACYFNVLKTIDKQYVRYCITSQRFINYAHKNATGSTIKNVGLKAMREFEIPLPPTLEEQHAIVAEIESRLSVCDKIEESIEQSLKQSESLRQSILKKAFEGKLVPQDPSDEPASKLLERIKAQKEKTESKRE
jgi:type I restriction enzyme S subunit